MKLYLSNEGSTIHLRMGKHKASFQGSIALVRFVKVNYYNKSMVAVDAEYKFLDGSVLIEEEYIGLEDSFGKNERKLLQSLTGVVIEDVSEFRKQTVKRTRKKCKE